MLRWLPQSVTHDRTGRMRRTGAPQGPDDAVEIVGTPVVRETGGHRASDDLVLFTFPGPRARMSLGGTSPSDEYWLPLDASGWSVIPEPTIGRKIYVSQSIGDDSNDGLSPTDEGGGVGPKQSIYAGQDMLRDSYDDHLLFKRGDTWTITGDYTNGENGTFRNWGYNSAQGGPSPAAPWVIGAYGDEADPRPRFEYSYTVLTVPQLRPMVNVVWASLDWDAGSNDDVGGFGVDGRLEYVLFEDMHIASFRLGLDLSVHSANAEGDYVTVRRSTVVDCNASSAHSQNMFVSHVGNFLCEECLFDHGGWDERGGEWAATEYNHNVYCSDDTPPSIFRNNIFLRGSGQGCHLRQGGILNYNFCEGNFSGFQFGWPLGYPADKVSGEAIGNVVTAGVNRYGDIPWGFRLQNIDGAEFAYNIVANVAETSGWGISIGSSPTNGLIENTDIHHNIFYNWPAAFSCSNDSYNGVTVRSNDFQCPGGGSVWYDRDGITPGNWSFSLNRFYSSEAAGSRYVSDVALADFAALEAAMGQDMGTEEQVVYTNPDVTLGDYDAAEGSGVGTLESFSTQAKLQRKGNWFAKYTSQAVCSWFRAQFDLELP